MKKIAFRFLLLVVVALAGISCKDDYVYSDLVQDNLPAVPVTYSGATTYGFDPYYETSIAGGGNIKITLSIPTSSGRTIKEITRVAAGATSINAGTLNTAGNYNTGPIAGNGTTAEFTTTIKDFNTKRPAVPTTPTTPPTGVREIAFIFLVTLDDGTEIRTMPVRIRVLP
ncbi:hypothetical protein LX87_01366 [Larkinella arboricola]|uniref:DUF1735 domain-containing protein n=1 Tax=Larkinella arboricola TaxID=643671 RepID=A0A327XAW4_LARAB|nr:hypothetical protein [Larkinella arboricola]RAK03244.1 hypothetical protein LX87_01366 [Larkinella arboricola]